MEIFDSPYYNISKIQLKFLGLWPYLSKTKKNLSLLTFTIFVFSLIIPLIAGLIRAFGKNTIMVVEDCIALLYISSIYLKYLSVYIFENRMKKVYELIANDWQNIKQKNELEILHENAREGQILTIIYCGYGLIAILIFNSIPFIPLFLDIIMPKNASYDRIYPYYPNYMIIDEQKYHYQTFAFHGMIVISITTLCATAIDTMFVANVKHSCGLFAIVCYRLGKIGKMPENEKAEQYKLAPDKLVYAQMKAVFASHKGSIECVDMIRQSFSLSFLFIMGAVLVGVAMLMFDVLLNIESPIQVMRLGVMLIGIYLSLFYLNWTAQQTVNYSEQVFTSAYTGYWYNYSVTARKLTSILMMRTLRPCGLSAGGVFDMNLVTFASIVKTSASYATIMLSMQQPPE